MSRQLKARPVDWGAYEKNGKFSIFVKLESEEDKEQFTWWGSLTSEKATEITIKALTILGFSSTDINYINEDDALDSKKYVMITVETENYDGKEVERVRWINPLRQRVEIQLKGVDIDSMFKKEYEKMGLEIEKDSPAKKKNLTVDDIPF